jgi:hypothetical protein
MLNTADRKKRGHGEDSVYIDHASECRDCEHHSGCLGQWRGSVSLGFGPDGRRQCRRVSGRIKTQTKDKQSGRLVSGLAQQALTCADAG